MDDPKLLQDMKSFIDLTYKSLVDGKIVMIQDDQFNIDVNGLAHFISKVASLRYRMLSEKELKVGVSDG